MADDSRKVEDRLIYPLNRTDYIGKIMLASYDLAIK